MERALPSSPGLGERLTRRYARSSWRLLALGGIVLVVFFVPLYALRGMRLVRLGIAALASLGIALAGFSRPFPTLLAAIFLLHSGVDIFLPGPVASLLLLLALARVGFDALGGARLATASRAFHLSFAMLVAIILTSLLVVTDWESALVEVGRMGLGVGLLVAISNLATHPSKVVLVFGVYAAALAVNGLLPLAGALAAGGPTALGLAVATRVGGLGTDTNVHATEVNCVLPLVLVAAGRVHGWRRWALGALVPLLVASVFITQSRAGVVVLVFALLATLFRLGRAGRTVAVLGLVTLGVVALVLPDVYWERFRSITQLQGIVVDRSLQIRQQMLSNAWDIFRSHPLTGVGLGGVPGQAAHYMLGGFVAHNTYLEIAGSLGIFGLLAYLAWLASGFGMLREAARRWRRSIDPSLVLLADGLSIALVGFCLSALTLSIQFYPSLWMLLGLANAARLAAQRTPQSVAAES